METNKINDIQHLKLYTILAVEDDHISVEYLKFALKKKYNLLFASSAEEALNLLLNNNINIILMDISIKGSMNGLELTEKIRNELNIKNLPILAVSAHAFEEDHFNSEKAGCNKHLTKPVLKKDLIDSIESFLI